MLRLMRLPNVFTAVADVLMGFVFARHSFSPGGALACLVAASALLYTAGMILNDVFDVEIDRKERPQRPLPAGQIPFGQARALGFVMLLMGVGFGWLAGYLYQHDPLLPVGYPWRSGAIATALAAAVLLYDGFLKKTPLGPVSMGLCRLLNVLLGMSLAPVFDADVDPVLHYTVAQWIVAAGIGVYITGVTIYAKGEVEQSRTPQLLFGVIVMVAGVVLLGVAGYFLETKLRAPYVYWALLALLTLTIARRSLSAAFNGSPPLVQGAIKHAIMSLIMLDAAVAAASGPPYYAIAIVALLAPALLLGKWVYST
jgi:4-hydroxybenzoate polyprenyltransferase